jgi:hypothetical protein
MLVICDHSEIEKKNRMAMAAVFAQGDEIARLKKELAESAPYWLCYSIANYIKREPCQRKGDTECKHTGDCLTEWCAPCAAKAWMKERRRLARQKPEEPK